MVTQPMYSPLNDWIVAIARLPVDCANNGTEVEVRCGTHGPIKAVTAFAAVLRRGKEAPHRQGLTASGPVPWRVPTSRTVDP